ncbi:MAG: NAD-dependent epimerase/dehydratase family protein, partial [Nitrospira sp.]|nr:NAD-dependent epimerase/dehydratase family protein [Nitrospira sp.]
YGDLQDTASLHKAVKGCQRLYHVAAHYSLWAPDSQLFYRINVDGTKNLMQIAWKASVERIVYTSTVGALGIPTDGRQGNEETPASFSDMVGDYKRSKYLAEQAVVQMAREGLPVVIVNPSAPVGPRDIKPTPTGQMIVDFLKGKMWAYLDTGMNLIDVEDVARGHILAMEKGRIGQKYILGHRNMTLREIFQALGKISGIKPPTLKAPYILALSAGYLSQWISWITQKPPSVPLIGVKMAKKYMYFDSSKAVRELGLPQSPIEEALEKAVRWFRGQ